VLAVTTKHEGLLGEVPKGKNFYKLNFNMFYNVPQSPSTKLTVPCILLLFRSFRSSCEAQIISILLALDATKMSFSLYVDAEALVRYKLAF